MIPTPFKDFLLSFCFWVGKFINKIKDMQGHNSSYTCIYLGNTLLLSPIGYTSCRIKRKRNIHPTNMIFCDPLLPAWVARRLCLNFHKTMEAINTMFRGCKKLDAQYSYMWYELKTIAIQQMVVKVVRENTVDLHCSQYKSFQTSNLQFQNRVQTAFFLKSFVPRMFWF